MSLRIGNVPQSFIARKKKKTVKPRTLKVISICSECGEPVCTTRNDKAVRHGFKRYKKRRIDRKDTTNTTTISLSFSQEDDKPCAGSGKEVVYKRAKKK